MEANAEVEAAAGVRQGDPAELAALSRLTVYIDQAALLMSAAFAAADIRDFAPGRRRQTIQPKDDAARWYADLTNDVLSRLSQVRHAVAHGWAASPEADALATEAIALLAELTPVPSQIVALYRSNRAEGLAELARHLEVRGPPVRARGIADRPAGGRGGGHAPRMQQHPPDLPRRARRCWRRRAAACP